MQLRIDREAFVASVKRAATVADRKSIMPVLGCVLVEADDGAARFTATDLDTQIVSHAPCEVGASGRVLLPIAILLDLVKSLPKEEPTLELRSMENHYAEMVCGAQKMRVQGFNPDDFPPGAKTGLENAPRQLVELPVLAELIDRTSYAMSTDITRFVLCGALLVSERPGMIRMVTTDGHRLASAERCSRDFALSKGVIIPAKAIHAITRLLGEKAVRRSAHVRLAFTDGFTRIAIGGVVMDVRLVDGQFPDYERVIPTTSERFADLSREAFAGALKRVSMLSKARAYGVKLDLFDATARISASDPEKGEAHEDLDLDYGSPPEGAKAFKIGFNARYMLDALGASEEARVKLAFGDDGAPIVVRSRDAVNVVMPMKVN